MARSSDGSDDDEARFLEAAGARLVARFDGPARAIRCARAIAASAHGSVAVRVGVHTGECELLDGPIGGVALQIAERVAAAAAPGEVLVSQTVRDTVAGSGIAFGARGLVTVDGIPGEWRMYAVA